MNEIRFLAYWDAGVELFLNEEYDSPVQTSAERWPSSWWRGQATTSKTMHPHMGARLQKEGSIFNMIVDPSTDRLAVPDIENSFGINSDVLCPKTAHGIEQEGGNQVLQKVKRGIYKYNNRNTTLGRKSKILCMVYTVDLPDSRANLKAQVETWASKCDGFWAASNSTDHTIGSIDLVHEGPESYDNMWQKVRSMWAYAYDHYLDEYDFFHICGDDTYIVVENLRAFLDGPYVSKLENGYLDEISGSPKFKREAKKWLDGGDYRELHGISTRPLYFGSPCSYQKIFPCGGPGYTLNRAALEVLGKLKIDELPWADLMDSREDLMIGSIFGKAGIRLSHVYDPGSGMRYGESAAFSYRMASEPLASNGLKATMSKYGLVARDYLDGISEEMASLHVKQDKKFLKKNHHTIPELLYRYHAILYDLCPKDRLSKDRLSEPAQLDTSL